MKIELAKHLVKNLAKETRKFKEDMTTEFDRNLSRAQQSAYDKGFKKGEDSVLDFREQEVAKGRRGYGQEFNQEYHDRKPYLSRKSC